MSDVTLDIQVCNLIELTRTAVQPENADPIKRYIRDNPPQEPITNYFNKLEISSACTIADSDAYTSQFLPKYYLMSDTSNGLIKSTANEIGHANFIHQGVV